MNTKSERLSSESEPEEKVEILKQTVIGALSKAFEMHKLLGESGEELVQKNQFGDVALRADIECEQAVLDFLKNAGIPIRVISEEHGTVDVLKNPKYLGILDGLDGSGVYKAERGSGRYGTMFGIFDKTDPAYSDYLVSGIMEHSTGKLFIATKNGGALVIQNGEVTPIHPSGQIALDRDVKINIDEWFEVNKKTFSEKLQGFKTRANSPSNPDASCECYIDVASGSADLTLECTRKRNLEIAIAYGLIKEAGGVMVDMNGDDLADKKYLEFGQTEKLPIITAATQELAEDLLRHIKE